MDLHTSGNQNLYLRHSYLSQSANRPTLESRIMYNESEKSLNLWLKSLSLLFLVSVILLVGSSYFWAPNDMTMCHNESRLSFLRSTLQARLFGKIDPNRCKLKTEVNSLETPVAKVTTITETKTCPLETESSESKQPFFLWRFFQSSFWGCDQLKSHNDKMQKQQTSIRPFGVLIPSLQEINDNPLKYAKYQQVAADSLETTHRPHIQFLFNEIEKDRHWISPKHLRDITHPDFLAPLHNFDFLLSLQLRAQDLVESTKVLSDKDAVVENLKKEFQEFGVDKNCTDFLVELKNGLRVFNEKKSHSLSLVEDFKLQSANLEKQISEIIKRKFTDENDPLTRLRLFEKEIEELVVQKTLLLSPEKKGKDYQSRISASQIRLTQIQQQINNLNNQIAQNNKQIQEKQIHSNETKLKFDNLLIRKGVLQWKLEFALRNTRIKEFVQGLLKKDSLAQDTIDRMMSQNEISKAEIVKMVHAFLDQSKGQEIEINVTENEMNNVIEKDKKEFEEIMQVFRELKDMIHKYKEVEIDIVALKKEITDNDHKIASAELAFKELLNQKKIEETKKKTLEQSIEIQLEEQLKVNNHIHELQAKLARNESHLISIDEKLSVLKTSKADLELQHKVY